MFEGSGLLKSALSGVKRGEQERKKRREEADLEKKMGKKTQRAIGIEPGYSASKKTKSENGSIANYWFFFFYLAM